MRTLLRRRASAGVTLVEVLIVVAIMALIAGGVAFAVLPEMENARKKTARTTALSIRQVAISYVAFDGGAECPTVELLVSTGKLSAAAGANDPWDQPFTIACSGSDIQVASNGPDKQPNTEDDIVVGTAAEAQ